jgi:hypothetical protein
MLHAHSGIRWIVLILLVVAIITALSNKSVYEKKNKMLNLFTMVFFHIQILLGFGLYFTSGKVNFHEGWMKEPAFRFFGMEHVLLMVIAMALITIGHSKSKKAATPALKNKAIIVFYSLTLLLVLAGIPWPFRNLGAGWF